MEQNLVNCLSLHKIGFNPMVQSWDKTTKPKAYQSYSLNYVTASCSYLRFCHICGIYD